jgi:hypothetical protein
MRLSLFVAMVLVGSLAAVPSAQAQSAHDPAAADELFNRGKELLAAGNWGEACPKFQASMALDPSVGALLKIARCHEHDGKLSLALHDYDAALALNHEKAGQTEQRRADLESFTRTAITQLGPRVPRLRVVLAERPAGLHVTRAGEDLPLAALGEALPVDPGTIAVVAEAPGFQTERRSIVLAEGQTLEVAITLKPPPPTADATRGTSGPEPERRPGWTSRKTWGTVAAGAGVVTLGVSGVLALDLRSKVSAAGSYCDTSYHCHQPGVDLLQQAGNEQIAAFVLLGAGAALVGTGLYLWLTPSSSPSSAVTVGVGPSSVLLRGQW